MANKSRSWALADESSSDGEDDISVIVGPTDGNSPKSLLSRSSPMNASRRGLPSKTNQPSPTWPRAKYPIAVNSNNQQWKSHVPAAPKHPSSSSEVATIIPIIAKPTTTASRDLGRGHNSLKTKQCRFFQQGFCKSGAECRYVHSLPVTAVNDGSPPSLIPTSSTEDAPSLQAADAASNSETRAVQSSGKVQHETSSPRVLKRKQLKTIKAGKIDIKGETPSPEDSSPRTPGGVKMETAAEDEVNTQQITSKLQSTSVITTDISASATGSETTTEKSDTTPVTIRTTPVPLDLSIMTVQQLADKYIQKSLHAILNKKFLCTHNVRLDINRFHVKHELSAELLAVDANTLYSQVLDLILADGRLKFVWPIKILLSVPAGMTAEDVLKTADIETINFSQKRYAKREAWRQKRDEMCPPATARPESVVQVETEGGELQSVSTAPSVVSRSVDDVLPLLPLQSPGGDDRRLESQSQAHDVNVDVENEAEHEVEEPSVELEAEYTVDTPASITRSLTRTVSDTISVTSSIVSDLTMFTEVQPLVPDRHRAVSWESSHDSSTALPSRDHYRVLPRKSARQRPVGAPGVTFATPPLPPPLSKINPVVAPPVVEKVPEKVEKIESKVEKIESKVIAAPLHHPTKPHTARSTPLPPVVEIPCAEEISLYKEYIRALSEKYLEKAKKLFKVKAEYPVTQMLSELKEDTQRVPQALKECTNFSVERVTADIICMLKHDKRVVYDDSERDVLKHVFRAPLAKRDKKGGGSGGKKKKGEKNSEKWCVGEEGAEGENVVQQLGTGGKGKIKVHLREGKLD